MQERRKIALAFMIVIACFALAVAVRLIVIHALEAQSSVLADTLMTALKEQLQADPKSPPLIAAIRAQDLRLRQDYFRVRRQYQVGAWLLFASLIGFVFSARSFFAPAAPQGPGAKKRRPGVSDESLAARARAVALSVGVVSALFLFALGYIGLRDRGDLPNVAAPVKPEVTPQVALNPNSPFKENWPGFRGPGDLGIARAEDWPTTWSVAEKRNILWKTEIPAATGKSSPIVWQDRIFLTGGDNKIHHVMCFDRAGGKLLWDKTVAGPATAAKLEVSPDAGFAAPTPVTDGRRVYAMFATGLLTAYDFDGNQVWLKNLGIPDSQYGFASSLILFENTLILQFDQGQDAEAKKSKLIGFDPATGNQRWATPRALPNSWATPALIAAAGHTELITCADPLVIAYDPASGKELWTVTGLGGDVVPSPAFDGERIIVTNDSAQTMAIKPGGSGDVTASAILWKSDAMQPDIPSPVSDGKRVLLVHSSGTLTCLDAADGKKVWEKSLETSFTASPVLAGKLIYLCGQDGVTRVFELGERYQLYAQGDIGEPIYITPAFADKQIYIRGSRNLFCIGAAE